MLPSPTAPPAALTRTTALFCTVFVTYAFLKPPATSGTATPNTSTRSMESPRGASAIVRRTGWGLIGSGVLPGRLDLGAMHQAARARIERIAPVQGAAVVANQNVAYLPLLAEG